MNKKNEIIVATLNAAGGKVFCACKLFHVFYEWYILFFFLNDPK